MVPRIPSALVLWLCLSAAAALAQETVTTDALIDELLDLDEQDQERFVEFDEVVVDLDGEEPITEEAKPDTTNEPVNEKVVYEEKPEGIKVKSRLESLSVSELQAICQERGFALEGENLQHADYVEAAQRCLSLEDEMNAIIAENPDLAAELETEIERMAREKERLEMERDVMLAEMEALEAQLKAAGMSLPDSAGVSSPKVPGTGSDLSYDPTSNIDVFRHSFKLLWSRVGADMRMVGNGLRIVVLKPAFQGLSLGWKYAGPTVEQGLKKVIVLTEPILEVEQIKVVRIAIAKQVRLLSGFVRSQGLPLLSMAYSRLMALATQLNQQEPVGNVTAVIGAVLGPVFEGLFICVRDIKPDLVNAQTHVTAWFRRLKRESHQQ